MCGIFFIKKSEIQIKANTYNYNNNELVDIAIIVENEFNKGKDRGPDDKKFIDFKNFYLGFHRLSINGLNEASNQPFNKNGVYLICNGEIYNYKELYSMMGIVPETSSDCEVLLDLYLLYPVEYFISLLDGVFAFIIYDTRKGIITVGRDPFGVRPMFYDISYSFFSSEMKQISNLTNNTINQFPPGHFCKVNHTTKINNLFRYHSIHQYYMPFCNTFKSYFNERSFYLSIIRNSLIESVKKRLLSDRPIACLLSGGLDSSLITSIVVKLLKSKGVTIETYSIGLPGSTDLIYAKKVAEYLGTKHTEVLVTEDDFFNSIPTVIEKIESYDTTTVRASVGNYLIAKYISENSQSKVIFNGDGSDELTGGYLYFHKAPNPMLFDYDVKSLLGNIHYFDVLRSDRSISSCGLEPRTPFLDKTFVNNYLSIPIHYRKENEIEKKLLRDAFIEYLPDDVLYRKKEAFSDGVSGESRSWFEIIAEKLENIEIPKYEYNKTYLKPHTKEQIYYRYLFEKQYPKRENIIPYFWMPKWSNTKDPSARTL